MYCVLMMGMVFDVIALSIEVVDRYVHHIMLVEAMHCIATVLAVFHASPEHTSI